MGITTSLQGAVPASGLNPCGNNYQSTRSCSSECTHPLCLEDLGLEPGQVVDSHLVFAAGDGDEDVLTLQHVHLLEPPARDQLVHWTHTGSEVTGHIWFRDHRIHRDQRSQNTCNLLMQVRGHWSHWVRGH